MIQVGDQLPTIQIEVTQAGINRYAEASNDFNPIHVDEEYAKKTFLGGVIAHGFLTLGYISQMMERQFGEGWVRGGELRVRFLAPARPGDVISTNGRVTEVLEEPARNVFVCEISCQNQRGENVLVGEARAISRK